METVAQWQDGYINLSYRLYHERFLDEQFGQLQKLQDDCQPDFVVEVVQLFFEDSEKVLSKLTTELNKEVVDFKEVDAHVHQFKGSSASIGAQRVKNCCVTLKQLCEEKNLHGCKRCLQEMKQECHLVKNELNHLFKLERQIITAGGTIPMIAQANNY